MVGRRVLPLLLVALLLSGCAAESGPSGTSTASSAPPTVAAAAAQTTSQASTTSAPTTSPPSSSSTSSSSSTTTAPAPAANSTATNSTQPPPPPAAPAIPTAPVVATCGTSAQVGVGANTELYVFFLESMLDCGPGDLVSRSGGPFRSAVIELAWSTALPTTTEVSLAVSERGGEITLGRAKGTDATLRVTLSGPDFPALASLDLVADVGASGLIVDFKGTVTFSLFETAAPPAGYSGVAA